VENLLEQLQEPEATSGNRQVAIEAPRVVRTHEPVTFTLEFRNKNLNGATARNEVRCEWEFGDGTSKASGWDATHFFSSWMRGRIGGSTFANFLRKHRVPTFRTDMAGYTVKVRFPDHSDIASVDRNIKVTGGFPWMPGRLLKTEILRLAVPLAIAIIGLQSVAQDKLQKSDLWSGALAVIAVGFGADAIKNLFTSARQR
jgi:hypothetical protein